MSQSGSNNRYKTDRPTISALLQEALDTPLERLSIDEPPSGLPSRSYDTPATPPVAHIDQSQHPHHHVQQQHITSPIRQTAVPEQIEPDGMPIIRPGGSRSGLKGLLNKSRQSTAASTVSGASRTTTSSNPLQDDQPLSAKRMGKLPLGPASRRLSEAQEMREEVMNLRQRSGAAQEQPGDTVPQPSRDSLDGVRIGGKSFSSLVASNPFQQEDDPTKSLISNNDPFQKKEPRSEMLQTKASRPRMRHRSSSTSTLETPPRHLQRTISSLINQKDGKGKSGLSQYPPDHNLSRSLPRSASFASLAFPSHLSLPKTKLPTFPSFPNVPMGAIGGVRGFSASARDDKSLWKTWWEGSGATAEEMKKDEKAREHAHKHMLDDADKGGTLEEEREHIQQKYDTPKNPIVFCHGLLGFDYIGPKGLPALQISHWRGICNVLQENGIELMIAKVPATSSAAQRAEVLLAAIEEQFPGREVNLVGHSMGGLDGRYLISKLKSKRSFKVASLTTIATPHRGSPFADYFIDNIIGRERLPSWLTVLDTVSFGAAGDGSAFQALTTRSMALFNEQVPDDPNVKYYSWGAHYQPGWFDPLRWSHDCIQAVEGDNDGLVSVESSKWGEFRGVLIGCSHVDTVGWVNHVRFTMEAWAGRPIAFKPATFYLEIADHLAKQGF